MRPPTDKVFTNPYHWAKPDSNRDPQTALWRCVTKWGLTNWSSQDTAIQPHTPKQVSHIQSVIPVSGSTECWHEACQWNQAEPSAQPSHSQTPWRDIIHLLPHWTPCGAAWLHCPWGSRNIHGYLRNRTVPSTIHRDFKKVLTILTDSRLFDCWDQTEQQLCFILWLWCWAASSY